MEIDKALIDRVLEKVTLENAHDVRNMVTVYIGVSDLADICDESRAVLDRVRRKMERFAASS